MDYKKIDEIMSEIEKDFDINYTNLKDKLFDIPKLHSKYLRLFFKYKDRLLKAENKLKSVYREKYEYYSRNYNYALNLKEVQLFIEGDKEYQKILYQVNILKTIVKIYDECVEKAKKLSFDIKNVISYLEYIQGV